jgi:hypothetical protein
MKRKLTALSQRYVAALRKHLKPGPQATPPCGTALALGRRAAALNLETLDVAKIHEDALATLEAASSKNGLIKRAQIFFAEAVTPIEETHHAALNANVRLSRPGGLPPVLEKGHRSAQDHGAGPQEKRGTLTDTFERITPPAEAFAAPGPPDSVGAGGQAKKDQPRFA